MLTAQDIRIARSILGEFINEPSQVNFKHWDMMDGSVKMKISPIVHGKWNLIYDKKEQVCYVYKEKQK